MRGLQRPRVLQLANRLLTSAGYGQYPLTPFSKDHAITLPCCDFEQVPPATFEAAKLAHRADARWPTHFTAPAAAPPSYLQTREWLKLHDVQLLPVDKSLGHCLARSYDVKLLMLHAFQRMPSFRTVADPTAPARAWDTLISTARALLKQLGDWPAYYSIDSLRLSVPKAVPCIKLHKASPAWRTVIGCGPRGINAFTPLVLRVFRAASASPYSVHNLFAAADAIKKARPGSLWTGDATAMFLNVPRDAMIHSLRTLCPGFTPAHAAFLDALLNMSYVRVCGVLMQQTEGVFIGMGSAPLLACAPYVLAERAAPRNLQLWRYMDDVLIIGDIPAGLYGALPMTFDRAPLVEAPFAGLRVTVEHDRVVVRGAIRPRKATKWSHWRAEVDKRKLLRTYYGLARNLVRLSSPGTFRIAPERAHFARLLQLHGVPRALCTRLIAAAELPPPPPATGGRRKVPIPYSPAGGGNLNLNTTFRYLLYGVLGRVLNGTYSANLYLCIANRPMFCTS